MKAKPECIICAFTQALRTARKFTDDTETQAEVLRHVAGLLSSSSLEQTPANLSKPAYTALKEVMGVEDPYYEDKKESNITAMELAKEIRVEIEESADPIDKALHAAAAGNLIDMGITHDFDILADLRILMDRGFAKSDIDVFRRELAKNKRLLYLGDNAGEIMFDKLLIEQLVQLGLDVTFTVKSGPIINDATMEDAETVNMRDVARVIETGSNDIGVNWESASSEFIAHLKQADIVLSKGQGNFETCNDRPENIYFLLKAKCELVARELEVKLGDIIFVRNPRHST